MPVMMDVSVELISATPDAERHIEICGREAYGSAPSETREGTENWIKARIRGWEHDVLEHSSATFSVTCSRVVSHEAVRHRIAAITQQSMRFREPKRGEFIVPPEVRVDDVVEWLQDYEAAFTIYEKWRSRYNRQTARYHLPHGMATSIKFTWNFREIRHILNMRWSKKAQPEMQVVASKIRHICIEHWPAVFFDFIDKELE